MRRSSGFTLIEVLIALFILAGGILMISLAWSGNFMKLRKSALFNDVGTLLERKMVEMEAKYRDKDLKEIPEDEEGDFGEDFPQYRWAMRSREMKFPDLTALVVGQDGGGDEQLIQYVKQLTEFLSKAIKEVRVTIFVKSQSGKEIEFAATQYFVDYNQDFTGGLGGAAGAATGGQPGTPGGQK